MKSPLKCFNGDARKTESALNMIERSKPTQELLAYYKQKVTRVEKQYEELEEKVDEMKSLCDLSSELQTELIQRNEEVSKLQQAVSDLQIYLFHERELALKLHAENDRLKLRELENKNKIEALLSMNERPESDLRYFMSNHTKAYPQKSKLQKKKNGSKSESDSADDLIKQSDHINTNQGLLSKQIESLQLQIEDLKRVSYDKTQALLKDREVAIEERQLEKSRFVKEIEYLASKLKQTQDNLCETTAKMIHQQREFEKEKNIWVEEKERLLHNVKVFKERNSELSHPDVFGYTVNGVGVRRGKKNCDFEKLKEQLSQSEELATFYQEQAVSLEAEINIMKEQAETNKNLFKEKTQKMSAQVNYIKNKYAELDRRRLLEAEGFRTDIKMLRERLKGLEKKLTKSSSTSSLQLSDQQLVLSARSTLTRAQHLERELNNIKSRMSQLGVL